MCFRRKSVRTEQSMSQKCTQGTSDTTFSKLEYFYFKRRKVIPQSYRLPDIYRLTVQKPKTTDLKNHHHLMVYLWAAEQSRWYLSSPYTWELLCCSTWRSHHNLSTKLSTVAYNKRQTQPREIESVGKTSPIPCLYQSILQYISLAVNIKQKPTWAHRGKLLFQLDLF